MRKKRNTDFAIQTGKLDARRTGDNWRMKMYMKQKENGPVNTVIFFVSFSLLECKSII